MAYDVKQLTRNELAQFLPNQRAISAFENLFNVAAAVTVNTTDVNDANINSSVAEAKAQVALDGVSATKLIADTALETANSAATAAAAAQITAATAQAAANAAQATADQAALDVMLLMLAPPRVF